MSVRVDGVTTEMAGSSDLPKRVDNPSCLNIIAKKRPPPMNIGFSADGIEPTRKVLYRNFHEINEKVFLVEISRSKTKVFLLLFPNFEKPDLYI